jgi:peptide/nickel transport system ATP-binding protein
LTTVLEVEGLSVGYGDANPVVWDVSFALEPGRVLGLAGESGCGKSTSALAAIGYRDGRMRILGGRSMLDGIDLLTRSPRELRGIWGRRIAYVAQNAGTALNPALTVGHQLAQPLRRHLGLRGSPLRARLLQLLDDVGIPDPAAALRRFPFQFSGGQQQRIALAIALACRPEVLILDEPTTGLDVTSQARITELLRTVVADSGLAALYVSHDLALLGTVADRLAIMYAGEIAEDGPTNRIVEAGRHPYTQALIGLVPSRDDPRLVPGIPGRPPLQVSLDACAFAPRCPLVIDGCLEGHVELAVTAPGQRTRCIRAHETHAPVRAALAAPPAVAVAEATPPLQVSALTCNYGKRPEPAVRSLSLTLAAGERIGIVGESGSGKSTLLRAIAGLHAPSAGTIRFHGDALPARAVQRSRAVRREIQLVFQNADTSLNPRQTVERLIARPIHLFDQVSGDAARARTLELLDAVGVSRGVLQRYPAELSGGQKQRVALARALAASPSILLCDEVTSALDVSVQATILELLSRLAAERGISLVFVSHDLAVVRTIATRILVMRQGEVCEEAGTAELFAAPTHPYTQELLAAIPEFPPRERSIA